MKSFKISKEEVEISYKNSNGLSDNLKIYENRIIIECERSSKIELKNLIFNETNTIHNQITKSLIFYYLKIGVFNEISKIQITRYKNSEEQNKLLIPNQEFDLEQILNKSFNLEEKINTDSIKGIFGTNQKSTALINSLTFLIKSKISIEPSEKFEKLWKAFNSIYYYFGNGANENECHRIIRKFLIDNKDKFPNTLKTIEKTKTKELRDKIRFRDLILNDYDTFEKTVSFIAFIFRYENSKLCEIFKETLVYREDFIKKIFTLEKVESKFNKFDSIKSLYQTNKTNLDKEIIYKEVVKYLDKNIQNPKENTDIEIIAFICIKYSYYLRNKIFHAEKHDLTFRFAKNKFIEEINWINNILENLIIEMLNSNNIWQQNGA